MSAQRSPMRLLAPPRSARLITSRSNNAETMSPPVNSGDRVFPPFIGLDVLCWHRQRALSSLADTAHGEPTLPSRRLSIPAPIAETWPPFWKKSQQSPTTPARESTRAAQSIGGT